MQKKLFQVEILDLSCKKKGEVVNFRLELEGEIIQSQGIVLNCGTQAGYTDLNVKVCESSPGAFEKGDPIFMVVNPVTLKGAACTHYDCPLIWNLASQIAPLVDDSAAANDAEDYLWGA